MYLTAQRVVDPSGENTGVNAFCHRHLERLGVAAFHSAAEVMAVANTRPGTLEEQIVQVAPGGNRVISFLDIVCEDGTSAREVADALSGVDVATEAGKQSQAGPLFFRREPLAIVYAFSRSLAGREASDFDELRSVALDAMLKAEP